jgi:chemotaxis protein MotB
MAEPEKEPPHEIVLIRRRNDSDHDEPHGGVWKVAFADFMTAMMAFFLVLWIVNSTTKQTRSSLARYFNPVRLSDTTPARKGLRDPKEEEFDASGNAAPAATAPKAQSAPTNLEGGSVAAGPPNRNASSAGGGVEGMASKTADDIERASKRYHDPFEPSRALEINQGPAAVAADPLGAAARDADALHEDLVARLGAEEASKIGAALDVAVDAEGLLISLTDRMEFGMFAIGSAEPEPRLVRVLGVIGQALRSRAGQIVIRGHTDSRPYRARGFDNWQLSSARAQAAFHSLVGGGFDDKRVERIEGYADRRLKLPEAPEAPENRRIEILIRRAKS